MHITKKGGRRVVTNWDQFDSVAPYIEASVIPFKFALRSYLFCNFCKQLMLLVCLSSSNLVRLMFTSCILLIFSFVQNFM